MNALRTEREVASKNPTPTPLLLGVRRCHMMKRLGHCSLDVTLAYLRGRKLAADRNRILRTSRRCGYAERHGSRSVSNQQIPRPSTRTPIGLSQPPKCRPSHQPTQYRPRRDSDCNCWIHRGPLPSRGESQGCDNFDRIGSCSSGRNSQRNRRSAVIERTMKALRIYCSTARRPCPLAWQGGTGHRRSREAETGPVSVLCTVVLFPVLECATGAGSAVVADYTRPGCC